MGSSIPPQSQQTSLLKGIRGSFLDCLEDPFYHPVQESVRYLEDGLLIIENGHIKAFGPYSELKDEYGNITTVSYTDRLIMPGFIDTHLHYPQTEMIAAHGEQLLEWLNQYTFPTELKFSDKNYAQEIAELFLDELLRNGTTTALVFTSVFPQSVDAFFEAAERRNLCMIAGKVMMDRNAPVELCDTAESSYQETKALIQKWHKRGRLHYAVTPRFAITSTDEQLRLAGKLLQEFSDVYLHTHLSENVSEVEWVQQLFPNSRGYLDTYDQAGLVQERSIFAHCVQLTDKEFQRLSQAGATIAFCPTSNLFLGSGLFKLAQAKSKEHPVKVGLGTDVGAGTSFSILQTASEAYKVSQLRHHTLSPFEAFYLATLGGAQALCLDNMLGNFEVGKAADFVVLNPQSTPLMALRNATNTAHTLQDLADRTFALMMLSDDRAVEATYILGKLSYSQQTSASL